LIQGQGSELAPQSFPCASKHLFQGQVFVTLGISLAIKIIPKNVLDEYRRKESTKTIDIKTKWIVSIIIILLWVFLIYSALKLFFSF
jgi:hypothetical protein